MKYRVDWMKTLFLIFMLCLNSSAKALSLFNESVYRPLIADKKAYLPGDLLTVIVMETANAETSSDLVSTKSFKGALEAGYNNYHHEVGFGLQGEGKSQAKTGRNGKIKAALTVRIATVQSEGRFRVEGEQFIRVNGEQQKIILSGTVRQEDISFQNTVLSTRLANAKISYAGNGSVSNAEGHNYLYKFLSFVGLV